MTKEGNIYEVIGQLMAKIDQLSMENSILEAKVKALTERLAKYETPKDSGNSSKPPSSDFPKPKKTQSLRETSEKNPEVNPGTRAIPKKQLVGQIAKSHSECH